MLKTKFKLVVLFIFLFSLFLNCGLASAAEPQMQVRDASYSAYQMKRLVLSKKSVSGAGGDTVKMIVVYQNKGLETWGEYKLTADSKQFADTSWLDEITIASSSAQVLPEKFLRLEFYFRLPLKKGDYNLQLKLQIDQGRGFEAFSLPVSVISNAQTLAVRLEREPNIRVGIAAPESNFLQFRSYEDDYKVYAGNTLLGILPVRKFAVLKFSDGQYSFSGGDLSYNGSDYLRLEPSNNPHAVFHVPNLISREAKWVDPNKKFNYYRGALEYRQGTIDKKMYIVNDLLLEDYVRGMAENSRSAPLEFVKANLVAARTYAYFSKSKYPFFDVLGNTFDQLYLGYEAEEELPNVIAGAEATRGMMVTYDNVIITTPYFGNSSGWTKSWKSVWGGANKPWLVPVRCNYDTGKRQNGHGVGMSQLDAYNRAKEERLDYEELLKYYYTGTEVERIYE